MGEGWSERVEVEVCNPPQLVLGWKIECPSGLRGDFTPQLMSWGGKSLTHLSYFCCEAKSLRRPMSSEAGEGQRSRSVAVAGSLC